MLKNLEEKYVALDGVRVRYVNRGSGSPVLLLHGFGECLEVWLYTIECLSEHHSAYALDMPGFGLSDKPDIKYTLPAATQFLDRFMEVLGIERASIVGHSLGGIIGLHMAAHWPDKVERLVLVDTMGLNNRASLKYRLCALPGVGEIVMKPTLKAGLRHGMRRAFYNSGLITEEMLDLNYRYMKSPGAKRALLSMLRNALDIRGPKREVIMTDKLPSIKAPTLFLHGSHDRVVSLKQAKHACRLMPDARIKVFDKCGHCPHMEKADEFCKEVPAFLDSRK